MNWSGKIVHMYIAEIGSAPMQRKETLRLISGVGVEGDRYATGRGHYSHNPSKDRQVTLIEIEALEAIRRDYGLTLEPKETRRNITTQGVPLNHLVDNSFRIGDVILKGIRLNVPCKYLEEITGKSVYGPLVHRSGLNCEILKTGIVHCGDLITPL